MHFDIAAITCVHCGAELGWHTIEWSNGTSIKALNWTCPQCGKCGITIPPKNEEENGV